MKMNTRIQLSIMMFLQFFIWGTWYVTLGTYLGEIGFDGSEIGDMYSTSALGAIIAPLFVGIVADRFFPAQYVLAFLHLVGAGLLYWVSMVSDPSSFYWILLLYSLTYMPTLAIVNAVSFYQMEDPGKEFPKIRVLGTLGWIAAGLLIGFMALEKTSTPLVIGAAASLLSGIYCFFLPNTPPKAKGEKVNIGNLLGLDALGLMKDRNFAVLVISSLLISIPLTFYYAWANPYFNEAGMVNAAGKMTLGQVSEVGFMLLMPFFFSRLGVKKMILIGMVAWIARYLLFAYGNNDSLVWMFYGGIILHGICYDFFFVTGQIYVDKEAPEDLRASAQGLIALVTYGIGMYIGNLVAGKVVESYEIRDNAAIVGHHWYEIWMIPVALSVLCFLVFLIFFRDKELTQ